MGVSRTEKKTITDSSGDYGFSWIEMNAVKLVTSVSMKPSKTKKQFIYGQNKNRLHVPGMGGIFGLRKKINIGD